MVRILVFVFCVVGFNVVSAQTSISTNIPPVSISDEIKESGKNFFSVNLSNLDDKAKDAFLESVYKESRIFPVSVLRKDDTILICAHESVLTKESAQQLLEGMVENAKTGKSSGSTLNKVK